MNVVFRVDASVEIGSGHVMRCLTLANDLTQKGHACTFITRAHSGCMAGIIRSHGYDVIQLDEPGPGFQVESDGVAHAKWLGVRWEFDAQETIDAISLNVRPDWLVVDHYGIDARWHIKLREYVNHIMVIDDLADRQLDCNVLLDQNLVEEMSFRYDGLVPVSCKKLLGPKYAMLRPEFIASSENNYKRTGKVENVLVFFGGADVEDETSMILDVVADMGLSKVHFNVIVGVSNPRKESVRRRCDAMPNVDYYCQTNEISTYMSRADIGLGAVGTATWERCALGLPAIAVAAAENQVAVAEAVSKAGAIVYLGKSSEVNSLAWKRALNEVLEDSEKVRCLSAAAMKIVDGRGVTRVVNAMMDF